MMRKLFALYLFVTFFLGVSPHVIHAQIPTPTAYPAGASLINPLPVPSLWDYTDEAITMWNYDPNAGSVVQLAIIVVMVIGYVYMLITLIQRLMDNDQ